jgi:hypothetical protein
LIFGLPASHPGAAQVALRTLLIGACRMRHAPGMNVAMPGCPIEPLPAL